MKTKKERIQFIIDKLTTDYRWQVRALLTVFNNQTQDEQICSSTHQSNGIGFRSTDADILSSFAKQIQSGRQLSDRQREVLSNRIRRYSKQVLSACDVNKLDTCIEVSKMPSTPLSQLEFSMMSHFTVLNK